MPISHHEGRDWVAARLRRAAPRLVVDVGAGEGIYSILMRGVTRRARWECVEVWEPYVDAFGLREKYDQVHVADARSFDFPAGATVLLGDVVEHMPERDARQLLAELQDTAAHVMVSVPIVRMEQGAHLGNPFEAHLYHWSWEEMDAVMGGCDSFRGEVLGRWWWSR